MTYDSGIAFLTRARRATAFTAGMAPGRLPGRLIAVGDGYAASMDLTYEDSGMKLQPLHIRALDERTDLVALVEELGGTDSRVGLFCFDGTYAGIRRACEAANVLWEQSGEYARCAIAGRALQVYCALPVQVIASDE